jgi:hypothetical protein
MKLLILALLTLSTVHSSVGKDIDKKAALRALEDVEVEHVFSNGNKADPDIVSQLLKEPFHTEFQIVSKEELKKKRFEMNYTVYGNQSAFLGIDQELIEVAHDTGFIGGFLAYLDASSYEVILIQIVPEG